MKEIAVYLIFTISISFCFSQNTPTKALQKALPKGYKVIKLEFDPDERAWTHYTISAGGEVSKSIAYMEIKKRASKFSSNLFIWKKTDIDLEKLKNEIDGIEQNLFAQLGPKIDAGDYILARLYYDGCTFKPKGCEKLDPYLKAFFETEFSAQ